MDWEWAIGEVPTSQCQVENESMSKRLLLVPVVHEANQDSGRGYERQKTSSEGNSSGKGVEARLRVHLLGLIFLLFFFYIKETSVRESDLDRVQVHATTEALLRPRPKIGDRRRASICWTGTIFVSSEAKWGGEALISITYSVIATLAS